MQVHIGFSVLNFLYLFGFFPLRFTREEKEGKKKPIHYITLYSNEG